MTSAVAQSTLPRMEHDEMGTLDETVSEVTDTLKAKATVQGTYLPVLVVEAQTALAKLSDYQATKALADLIVHVSLRRGPSMTPRRLLAELLERYPISDASFYERVGPELRRVLAEAGHVYQAPAPVRTVPCEQCGRDTTGDYTWDWPGRRMVVCSVCHIMGQPETAPVPAA